MTMRESPKGAAAAPEAPTSPPVGAGVLVIGNEILSGRTRDANLPYLGRRLDTLGIPVREARIVPDERNAIVTHLTALRQTCRYVFTTGGIGPTHDDITAACVAEALGLPLVEHPQARAILDARYRPDDLTEARLRMARMPEGASLIDNPVSALPGFQIENVYVLAGIPSVMQAMFDSLAPGLVGGPPLTSASVVATLREGDVAGPLGAIQDRFPEVSIGSYPFFGARRYGLTLVLRGPDPAQIAAALAAVEAMIRDLGAAPERPPDDGTSPDGG